MIYNLRQSLDRILSKYKFENIVCENSTGYLQIIETENKLLIQGDIKENFEFVIESLIKFIIKHKYKAEFHVLSCIQKLDNLKNEYLRDFWLRIPENEKIIDDILKDKNFVLFDKYILYRKKIMVEHIIFKDKCYSLTKEFIKQNNIYIEDVHILIFKSIISILGKGNHPNLSLNGEFCFDTMNGLLQFNYNNLNLILHLCKIANLDKCYNFDKNILIYKEIIK